MTMYRAMVYYLRFLLLAAIILSAVGILPYNWWEIALAAFFLSMVCYLASQGASWVFKTSPNIDSGQITAHILALIVGPVIFAQDWFALAVIAVVATLSKYVVAFRKHHIFNPAAFAVVISALVLNQGAPWWVGSVELLPFVIIGGVWVMREIRRWHLTLAFLAAYLLLSIIIYPLATVQNLLINSAIIFFSLVMLIEPITSPAGRQQRIYFGIFVAAALATMQKFIPSIPYTLELALLAGNAAAIFTKPAGKLALRLNRENEEAKNTKIFWFERPLNFQFVPGQFLEWTLPHPRPDNRGTKRFFTITSSPTEPDLALATRFAPEKSSTFKSFLKTMSTGTEISASDLDGDFTLPKDSSIPLVFIAGGIGITPFRSMTKYLLDKNEKRDIVLLYSNKTEADVAFRGLFESAARIGLRAVFLISERDGNITAEMIKKEVPDWKSRIFYVSGPEPMVEAFEKMLKGVMGIKREKVKRDYFPGYLDI